MRPEGFDLATAWSEITDTVDELRLPLRVRALVAGELAGLGQRVEVLEPAEVRQRLAEIAAELRALYA